MEKDTLTDDLADFAACVEAEREQRKESLSDLEFVKLGKQWDQKDADQRGEDGRPCLTINRLSAFTKQVTNDGRLNRASINIKPVGDGADKETADILSDLVRNIETASQSPVVYDTAFDFAVNCGVGYFRVNVDYTTDDAWDQDIALERIDNPFSVYGDHESKQATSIDWNRAYVTDWYSKKAFEAKFGTDRKAASIGINDREYDESWNKDGAVRVAERWYREEVPTRLVKLSSGVVMYEDQLLKVAELLTAQGITVVGDRETKTFKVGQRIITGSEILEENDWLGKYIPIIPMYGEEVNVNGKRHFISLVRRAKDAQRLYNYMRSLTAELGALQPKAPWMGPVGMFNTDGDRWATANRKSHATLEYDVVPEQPGATPQRIPFAGVPSGAMQEALNANDDMKAIMGMYDASLGARSNETSGRAIMARQREGDVSTYDFLDNRNRSVEHGGRVILDLIPRVYSVERVMRCMKEDGTTYAVPVNQPVIQPQQLQAIQQGQMPPPQPQQAGQAPQYVPVPQNLPPMPPQLIESLKAVTRVFDLTAGKYDVTVTAGPSFTSRREEAATQMMEFIRVFPQAAGLIGDLLAKNLDWPGAEQVADRLKAMVPPQARGQVDPMVQQLQGMLQQQDQQAKQAVATLQGQIAELQRAMGDKSADNALKARELEIKAADAETKRMQVLKPEAPQVPPAPDPVKVEELRIAQREAEIKAYEAETERLKVLGATITPEQVQALVAQTVMQAMANQPTTHTQETIIVQPAEPPEMEEPEEPEEPEGQEEQPQQGGFFAPERDD